MNQLQIKTPQLPSQIKIDPEWIKKAEELAKKEITVNSQKNFEEAEILLKQITSHSNSAEKKRKEFSKPFREFASKIKKLVDEARLPIEEKKKNLKKEMVKFIEEEEKRKEEKLNVFDEQSDLKIQKTMSTSKAVWKFEIEKSNLVPRSFCIPDEKKIRKYVNQEKEAANLPGVKIWQETTIQPR